MTDVQPEWRLADRGQAGDDWSRWASYLSERHWGTVREDYSADGDAWSYLPYDQSRSRAYRWGKDGLAGFSDRDQRLCLAVALWNGREPVLDSGVFDEDRYRNRIVDGTRAGRIAPDRLDRARRRRDPPPARGGALPPRHPAHPGPRQAAMTTTVTTPPAGSPVLPGVPFPLGYPLGATPGRHRVPGRRPHLHPCTVPARTVWIIDTTDSPGTVDDQFHPLVNGSTRDFVPPVGWTTPRARPVPIRVRHLHRGGDTVVDRQL